MFQDINLNFDRIKCLKKQITSAAALQVLH
jgi:hypothetical protein